MTALPSRISEVDLFYQIEECVYYNYKDVFIKNDEDGNDIKFDFVYHAFEVTRPIRLPIIDDNSECGIVSMSMLDKCLNSENEYPGTFWRHLLDLLTHDDFHTSSLMSSSRMFITFISFLARFNETYPKVLPSIIHSTYEMHRAGRFVSDREQTNPQLIHQVYNTNILSRYEDPQEPNPADPIHDDEVDLSFLDDL